MPKRGTGTAITPETTTDHTAPIRGLVLATYQPPVIFLCLTSKFFFAPLLTTFM